MTRALDVARHDFENVARSYLLRGVVAVFTVLLVLITTLPGLLSATEFTGRLVLRLITPVASVIVPITAIVAGYLAVAGERESGSLKILLGLPPTRRDVLLGKFLARSAVVVLGVVVAFVVAAVADLLVYGVVQVGEFLLTMALTALLGVAFVGLAVGISAATSTRARAMTPAIALFVLLVVLWDGLLLATELLVDWIFGITIPGPIVTLLTVLSPSKAYGRLFDRLVLPDLVSSGGLFGGGQEPVTDLPVYLQDWFVLGLVVLWAVVPIVLGYWRFARADLE